jgi:Uma2 family endonuclease
MRMQIALPELNAPATLILDREDRLTDDEYFAFCVANPDLNVERTAEGDIVIVPPPGGDSDYRNLSVSTSLNLWARMDGRGKALGPTVHFLLPDGSGRSPDAAWVSNERLTLLSKQERRQFLRVVPEFVVEVLSPSDRLKAAQKKMHLWAANCVELGWLIDADARRVHVYRGTSEPRVVADAERIAGEGPVEGFVLQLGEIWEGL